MRRTKRLGKKAMCALMAAAISLSAAQAAGTNKNLSEVCAVEFTVKEAKAVLYSNDKTKVYNQPDVNSGVVTSIAKDVPVDVTGITSNGWFRVSIKGTYYIPGDGLVEKSVPANTAVVAETDIKKITKGTFSFFKNPTLGDFEKSDIEDMDVNTYIKYLDSYLMGYALFEKCIMQDSGKRLKDVYESEAKTDPNVAGMSQQAYLINYRNKYLSDSLAGPFRNEKDLKQALNRAIRYEINKFGTVYKNSSVGNDEDKITKIIENITEAIKAEQGVSFTCRMEYGDYKTSDGSEGKGWIIEFTRKD